MPESLWSIGFAVSVACTALFGILTGRKVFKSGIEYFSSRILILSAIADVTLCCLLFLLEGVRELYGSIASASFTLGQLLVGGVFLAVPGRIVWNYLTVGRRLRARFALTSHEADAFTAKVTSLSEIFGIAPPAVLSSMTVNSPFVFGCRSKNAFLAVPKIWHDLQDEDRRILVLHELAHIRNRDVGFLTWSQACIQDLRWLCLLLPALIVCCYAFGYERATPALVAFLACSLVLYVLLRYVIRKRESLADMTAALLMESGRVEEAVLTPALHGADLSSKSSRHKLAASLADRIRRWLADRALFSKRPRPWRLLLRFFEFLHSGHPSRARRSDMLVSARRGILTSHIPPGDCFWAGIAFGLLGVIIGLGGYWFSILLGYPEQMQILHLPFKLYGLAAVPALGSWVLFLTIPHWSLSQNPRLDGRFLLSQLKNNGIALAGACLTCPIVLTAGVTEENVQILTVMCAMWYVFIGFFGFTISIASVFLWITIRYLQSSQSANLKKGFQTLAPFAVVVVGLVVTGLYLINNSLVFAGTNLIFSTIIGVVVFLLALGHSRFSEDDEYAILCLFGFTVPAEGRGLGWKNRVFYLVGCPVLLIGFGLPVYLSIGLFARSLDDISVRSGLLFLIITGSAVLIIIRARDIGRIGEAKRTKIYRLSHCMRLLAEPISEQLGAKIGRVAIAYGFNKDGHARRKTRPTINDAYEHIHLISRGDSQPDPADPLLRWVLECECPGGFGPWPESSPRLCSTYQALSILSEREWLYRCDADTHASWIKSLQQPEGSFKGPWSKRTAWEETFYAIRSLRLLGAFLEPDKASLCRSWCHHALTSHGLQKNRLDVIYYCMGALDAISGIDDETSNHVSAWLSSTIERLLLTNIALNYEEVHFAVMTYSLLCASCLSQEHQALLTERIQAALEAELADISA